jgi:hypothetical protein
VGVQEVPTLFGLTSAPLQKAADPLALLADMPSLLTSVLGTVVLTPLQGHHLPACLIPSGL